jgi:hypothetical protein
LSRGKFVADEQLIDNELDFLGVQIDMTSLPPLEAEVTARFRVDLGI